MLKHHSEALSDADLTENIQNGQYLDQCFSELYRRWNTPLFAFFRRRRFTADECLDLSQAVWERAYAKIGQFQGHYFPSWLFRIANNTYKNEIRSRQARKRRGTTITIDTKDDLSTSVELTDPRPIASNSLIEREKIEALQRSLNDLPARMGQCVTLRVTGHKIKEIAVLLKISEGTVKAHLHQAKARLTKDLSVHFVEMGF